MTQISFNRHSWRYLTAALATMLLVACGGGGAGDSAGGVATAGTGTTAPVPVTPGGSTTPDSGTVLLPAVPATPDTPATPAAVVLALPIEVLGDGSPLVPIAAEARLGVAASNLSAVTTLWFQCHRCGFYGAPEFEAVSTLPVKVKASVRFLGGASASDDASVPWIAITDANVTLADDERLHGGINGGLYTTRISVALDAAMRARLVALPAYNRVQFRFNGTDGESNGFRILNVQLQDAAAADVGSNTIQRFDPASERDASALSAADVAAGKALWYAQGRIAKSSIVSRTLQAACASCHAANGRDLQYFNYSNNAIVQRSRFHGLGEAQGKQIAAFLRSSLSNVAYVAKARPWNPPYQPGAGVDCAVAGCATAWGAGAGLDAVLGSPAEALKAVFGKPLTAPLALSQSDVDAVMNVNATMNVREMPVAMQFPDWNAWLPTIHPLDIWPTKSGGDGFENGSMLEGQIRNPNARYTELLAWLTGHKNPNGNMADWSHLTPALREQVMEMFTQSGWEGYRFVGGGRGNHIAQSGVTGAQVGAANMLTRLSSATAAAGPAGAFTTNAFIERSVGSMFHWLTTKQWEMAQEFSLEGNQQWFIGTRNASTGVWNGRGEAHGWPFNTVSLFFLAPHMLYQGDTDAAGNTTRENYQAWESGNIIGSYYRTNQWYQLQMTVNAGGQSGWSNYPMDWPYLTAFDELVAEKVGTQTAPARAARNAHYVRLLQGRIKEAQYANNDLVLYEPAKTANLFDNEGRYGRAQILKHVSLVNFLDRANRDGVNPSPLHLLDDVSAGLYLKVVNGAMQQFNQLYAQTAPSAWRRCDPNNTQLGEAEPVAGFRYCLDVARTPLGTFADGTRFMNVNALYQVTTEQTEQYGIWKAGVLGADAARIKVWRDWTDAVWQ